MDTTLSVSLRNLTLLSLSKGGTDHIDDDRLERIVSPLVVAAGSLPSVPPSLLSYDRSIGAGTSFRVDREILREYDNEPYYVAVKHMVVKTGRDTSHSYRTLVKEMRIFTHPPLRGHTCILRAIGFGWNTDPEHERHPYVVVDYSDHGTISNFLRKCNTSDKTRISLSDRRELALDVAVGLKALHDNRFIHGDIKPGNVLVFDTQDDTIDRIASIAKISDFGSTLSEDDIRSGAHEVLGTSKYSAPELDLTTTELGSDEAPSFESLARCDVYSFGLLLWEVIKSGLSYDEMMDGPNADKILELRQRYYDENDGLLKRAHAYCSSFQYPTEHVPDQHPQSPDNTRPRTVYVSSANDMECSADEFNLFNIFKETLTCCLRDDPGKRKSMNDVVTCLAKGTTEERQPASHRTRRIGIPRDNGHYQEFGSGVPYVPSSGFWHLQHRSTPNSPFKQVDRSTVNSEQFGEVEHLRGRLAIPEPKQYIKEHFNFLESSMVNLGRPQWEIQVLVARELHESARLSEKRQQVSTSQFGGEPISEEGQALLQLSICYHIGFGVEPNNELSLDFLGQAANAYPGSLIVNTIKNLVEMALSPQTPALDDAGVEELDFTERVRLSQQRANEKMTRAFSNLDGIFDTAAVDLTRSDPIHPFTMASTMFPMVVCSTNSDFSQALAEKGDMEAIRKKDLYATLTIACRYGRFEAAVALALAFCGFTYDVFNPDEEYPNPLHWLINFEPRQAVYLAGLLIRGPSESQEAGPCASVRNAIPDGSVFLPEHCMELHGSPLHWAVRTGNLLLVKALVELDCDINSRWISESAFDDGQKRLEFSPLDIAMTFHFPKIVDFLLQQRPTVPEFLPKDEPELWKRHHSKIRISAFHLIGQEVQPFARFIVHGNRHKEAVEQTISVAVRRGLDINYMVSDGEVPLSRALHDLASRSDAYILEALLRHGARVQDHPLVGGKNIASRVILDSVNRRFSAWKLEQVLHLVQDLDQCDDSGMNALHYCAITNAVDMAEALLSTKRVCIEARTSDHGGRTALSHAASFGKSDMVKLLIEKGANIESLDNAARSPLEWAVGARHLQAAVLLIQSGARTSFRPMEMETIEKADGLVQSIKVIRPESTVLHAATIGYSSATRATSMLRQLLEDEAIGLKMQEEARLNILNSLHCTPLQLAARRGDLDGLKALLGAGADPSITNDQWGNSKVLYMGTALEIALKSLKAFDRQNPDVDEFPWLKNATPSQREDYEDSLNCISRELSRR